MLVSVTESAVSWSAIPTGMPAIPVIRNAIPASREAIQESRNIAQSCLSTMAFADSKNPTRGGYTALRRLRHRNLIFESALQISKLWTCSIRLLPLKGAPDMQGRHRRVFIAALLSISSFRASAEDTPAPQPAEVVISAAEQKLMIVRDGMWVQKYRVSTSKFGIGDSYGSYKTPIGKLRVCDKIGAGLASGSVIRHRSATGEILPVNAPGRDPIVTRILWLEGLEAGNQNAKARGIYIHGTVEESKIGDAVSYGCIRMKSREVMEVFDLLPVGTLVTIQREKLPHLKRWAPAPVQNIAAAKPEAKPEQKASPKPEAANSETKVAKVDLKPIAEKLQPEAWQGSKSRAIVGTGHGVVSHNAASLLHRNHGVPSASTTSPSDSLKSSILFADLPKGESKAKQ